VVIKTNFDHHSVVTIEKKLRDDQNIFLTMINYLGNTFKLLDQWWRLNHHPLNKCKFLGDNQNISKGQPKTISRWQPKSFNRSIW
jgi:hypothetical protein